MWQVIIEMYQVKLGSVGLILHHSRAQTATTFPPVWEPQAGTKSAPVPTYFTTGEATHGYTLYPICSLHIAQSCQQKLNGINMEKATIPVTLRGFGIVLFFFPSTS